MAFETLSAAQIRTRMLAAWRARYLDLGLDLDVSRDSPAYIEADALSIELEGLQARAAALVGDVFPDTSDSAALGKHADLIGLSRKPAEAARFTVHATGTSGSDYLTTDLLSGSDGNLYAALADGTLDVSGATFEVEANAAGASGNKSTGDVLTWSSAPTGVDGTVTVVAQTFVGTDDESDASLLGRVLFWWRERPGSGNRADFVQWGESRSGVAEAYVLPLMHPVYGPHTLGSATLIVLGPAGKRVLPAGNVDDVHDYIAGINAYAADGGKVPANVDMADIGVSAAGDQPQNVTLSLVMGTDAPFGFTDPTGITVGSVTNSTTIVTATTSYSQITVGKTLAVQMPAGSAVRGRFAYMRVTSAVHATFSTITFAEPMPATPDIGAAIHPAPPNGQSIADAVVALFDRLGPGDVDTTMFPKSARWPPATVRGPYKLYRAALQAAAMGLPGYTVSGLPAAGVTGVVSADVTTPATDITPAPGAVLTPGIIRLVEAP